MNGRCKRALAFFLIARGSILGWFVQQATSTGDRRLVWGSKIRWYLDRKQDGPTPNHDLPPTSQLNTIMSDGPDLGSGNGRDLRWWCGFRPTVNCICVNLSSFLCELLLITWGQFFKFWTTSRPIARILEIFNTPPPPKPSFSRNLTIFPKFFRDFFKEF